MDEPGDIAARPSQASNKTGADRIGNNHEYDRDRARLALQRGRHRSAVGEDGVGPQLDQLLSVGSHPIDIAAGPAIVDAKIAAFGPAQLPKIRDKRRENGLGVRITLIGRHQHTNAPRSVGLLRARRQRPCCRRATEKRDELAPPHVPPPGSGPHYEWSRRYHIMSWRSEVLERVSECPLPLDNRKSTTAS